MTLVACPKCADLVALPDRASRRATVRCPLCQEQFPLTEVLDKLPPALVVVDDPEAADAALDGGTAPENWGTPAVRDAEGAGGFAPLNIETEAERAPATGVPRGRRPAARAKRKPKNPVMEGVKIVLGGQILSSSAKTDFLRSRLSSTASMIRSQSLRSESDSVPRMR